MWRIYESQTVRHLRRHIVYTVSSIGKCDLAFKVAIRYAEQYII